MLRTGEYKLGVDTRVRGATETIFFRERRKEDVSLFTMDCYVAILTTATMPCAQVIDVTSNFLHGHTIDFCCL